MIKKGILYSLLLVFSIHLYATDTAVNQEGLSVNTEEETMVNSGLELSKALLATTEELAKVATQNNEESQKTVLQLSRDIGTMADRINTMADKIVATQNIQSSNLETTEKNMLEAQKNLLGALGSVNNTQAQKNLKEAKTTLENAISLERVNSDIAKSKSVDEMIEKMGKTAYKYRYKYMNAIKENISSLSQKDAQEAFQNVVEKIDSMRSSTQKDMSSTGVSPASVTTPSGMDSVGSMSSPSSGMDSSMGGMDSSGMGGMGSSGMGGGMF